MCANDYIFLALDEMSGSGLLSKSSQHNLGNSDVDAFARQINIFSFFL